MLCYQHKHSRKKLRILYCTFNIIPIFNFNFWVLRNFNEVFNAFKLRNKLQCLPILSISCAFWESQSRYDKEPLYIFGTTYYRVCLIYIGRHNILVTRTELSMYRNNSCCLPFVLQIGILVINLSSLINCRTMLGVIFMHTLITGEIASCGLTSQLNFCNPTRLTLNYRP